jgi:hypothetical protein
MGEFTSSDTCWKSYVAKSSRSASSCLTEDRFQKVQGAAKGTTTLDLVLTNEEEQIEDVDVIGTLKR